MHNDTLHHAKVDQPHIDRRAQMLELLRSVARAIIQAFGPDLCEVVIHDLSDLEHSIIWIEGDVTHRKVGGSMTDLGLNTIRAGKMEGLYSYRTQLEDGTTLNSCSIFLRDDRDSQPWGAFCINFNITPLLGFQQFLESFAAPQDDPELSETFSDSIENTIQGMIRECVAIVGKSVSEMGRSGRLEMVRMLERKGAFQVRKAVPIVAQHLDVSRYTVYNYLTEIRADNRNGEDSNDPS